MEKFQFPSNGKVDPNKRFAVSFATLFVVFQFPSNGKVDPNGANHIPTFRGLQFQFPSNGKVDPNESHFNGSSFRHKFQFPSNGKVDPNLVGCRTKRVTPCFNSLQTGKWILTKLIMTCNTDDQKFQFPSNGKVDPNSHVEGN